QTTNYIDDAALFDRAATAWLAIKPWVTEGKPPLLEEKDSMEIDKLIEEVDELWKSHKKMVDEQDEAQEINGDDQVLAALEKGEKQMQKAEKVGAVAKKKLKKKNQAQAMMDDFFGPLENGAEEAGDNEDDGNATLLPQAGGRVLPKKRSRQASNITAGVTMETDQESEPGASSSSVAAARSTATFSGASPNEPVDAAPAAPA
ncbi:unnamed protein product, partial [Amoebophrya sp. A25]